MDCIPKRRRSLGTIWDRRRQNFADHRAASDAVAYALGPTIDQELMESIEAIGRAQVMILTMAEAMTLGFIDSVGLDLASCVR
jgi:hypothetical protein